MSDEDLAKIIWEGKLPGTLTIMPYKKCGKCEQCLQEAQGDEIFLIEKLCIDQMENELRDAWTYVVEGFVYTQEEADDIVAAGGKYDGTGWPVAKGVSIDYYRAFYVEKFKAPASQMENEGKLSASSKAKIDAKANKVLGKKKK
jgi:hypothetical protein